MQDLIKETNYLAQLQKTQKRDRRTEPNNNNRWEHTWSLQLCFLDVVVELEACGIPVTWLLMPTLTSVRKCHGLRKAGLWIFWAAPPASAHRWPTVSERAMHGQGLLGQAQWGLPQVDQWGHPLALTILEQVNSCIKIVLCANIGTLFDLHQQLTSATVKDQSLAHVAMKMCLAKTVKDPPGSCEEKCGFEPLFKLYFYSRCSSNYTFVRYNLVWFPCFYPCHFAEITAPLLIKDPTSLLIKDSICEFIISHCQVELSGCVP